MAQLLYLSGTLQVVPERPKKIKRRPILFWNATNTIMLQDVPSDTLEAATLDDRLYMRWWDIWPKKEEYK